MVVKLSARGLSTIFVISFLGFLLLDLSTEVVATTTCSLLFVLIT